MEVIHLVHISDLHLSLRYRWLRSSPLHMPCLEELARLVHKNATEDHLDGLLVTGDIADSGDVEDLALSKKTMFPDGYMNEPWLGSHGLPSFNILRKPIAFLPGNHDKYKDFFYAPGSTKFDNYFSNYWKGGSTGISSWLIPNNDDAKLKVVCVDFSLKKWHDVLPNQWIGCGKVYRDRLRALTRETKKAQDAGLPVIWALHFAPDTDSSIRYGNINPLLKLYNSRDLIAEAQVLNIFHLFCGHIHYAKPYKVGRNHRVCVYASGTCTNLKDKPSINFIKIFISNNQVVKVLFKVHEWNDITNNYEKK